MDARTDDIPAEFDADLIAEGGRLARVNLWRLIAISGVVAWIGGRVMGGAAPWLRLALVGATCAMTWRGHRWALLLLGFLTVFAGALMVVQAVVQSGVPAASRLLLGGLGVVQVSAFLILYNAPEVRAFFLAQRRAMAGGRA